MATTINNQATLNYTSGANQLSTSSNIASVTLQGPLEAKKYSLENSYQIGEEIVYNVFITNTSPNTLTNLVIEDDLGTYAINTTTNVTPLTYVGPAKAFVNHVFNSNITGTVSAAGDLVTFPFASLAPGDTLLLEYVATVNEYAGAAVGTSEIENIVSVTATGVNTPIIATNTIPVGSYAQVVIEKAMTPNPVVDGSTLTYTFTLSNYGTIAATNISLKDTFAPIPNITSVSVNGGAPTSDYDLNPASGEFVYPKDPAANYTIAAAAFNQNTTTGVVTIVPTTSTVVVTGTI